MYYAPFEYWENIDGSFNLSKIGSYYRGAGSSSCTWPVWWNSCLEALTDNRMFWAGLTQFTHHFYLSYPYTASIDDFLNLKFSWSLFFLAHLACVILWWSASAPWPILIITPFGFGEICRMKLNFLVES